MHHESQSGINTYHLQEYLGGSCKALISNEANAHYSIKQIVNMNYTRHCMIQKRKF